MSDVIVAFSPFTIFVLSLHHSLSLVFSLLTRFKFLTFYPSFFASISIIHLIFFLYIYILSSSSFSSHCRLHAYTLLTNKIFKKQRTHNSKLIFVPLSIMIFCFAFGRLVASLKFNFPIIFFGGIKYYFHYSLFFCNVRIN